MSNILNIIQSTQFQYGLYSNDCVINEYQVTGSDSGTGTHSKHRS